MITGKVKMIGRTLLSCSCGRSGALYPGRPKYRATPAYRDAAMLLYRWGWDG